MNLDNTGDRIIIVNDLMIYANSITDKMSDDSNADPNDWSILWRFMEKLAALFDHIDTENIFFCALDEMRGMKRSDEDNKLTFPIEKAFNQFIKEVFLPNIDDLVDCSRSFPFEDYRARNFQNELLQKITMLRDWYKDKYNEDDNE